jgi:hypothetical protein
LCSLHWFFNGAFSILTKLQTRQSGNQGSVPVMPRDTWQKHPNWLGSHPALYPVGIIGCSLVVKLPWLQVVTMYLLLRLRMHGANICSPMCLNCVVLNYAQRQLLCFNLFVPKNHRSHKNIGKVVWNGGKISVWV